MHTCLLYTSKVRFPDELVSRYGDLDMSLKGHEILEEICIKKAWVQAGGCLLYTSPDED